MLAVKLEEIRAESVDDIDVDVNDNECGGSRSTVRASEVEAMSSERPLRPKCACTVSTAEARASKRSRSFTDAADAV